MNDSERMTDYLTIGPIGSRNATLTWTRSDDCICTGRFHGAVEEFAASVEKKHGGNAHGKAYRAALAMIAAYRDAYKVTP